LARYKCRKNGEFASTAFMLAGTVARRIHKMNDMRAERPGDEGVRGGMGAPGLRRTGKSWSGGSSSAAVSTVPSVATMLAAPPVPRGKQIAEQGSDSANVSRADRGGNNGKWSCTFERWFAR
jgi:hypothetical protein